MKKKYIAVIALVVVLSLGLLVLTNQPKAQLEPIKIGLVVWPGYGPLYVAEEKGFFGDTGVELVRIDTTNVKSVMKTKHVDAISFPSETIQLLNDAGVEVKSVLNIDVSDGGDGIVASNDIKTMQDLKGKTVAFEPGSPSHFFLLYELDKAGLTSDDIIAVETTVPDAGIAFLAGEVDAAVTWEPWLSEAAEKDGHMLASTKGTTIINDLLTFRKEVVDSRPNDIKAIIQGYFLGLDYTRKHPVESKEIMARYFELPMEDLKGMIAGLRWFDYEDNLDYFGISDGKAEVYDIVDKAGEYWEREGLIKEKANLQEILDPSYLVS